MAPGRATAGATPTAGRWLADLFRATEDRRDFRIVCPDELESNKLGAVLTVTGRGYTWPAPAGSEHLAPDGRVLEVFSEHLCQGWLQGYLLTGRHGLFPCYEAFAAIVDSMANQHAKFLKLSAEVPWRAPVASLNYLLTSEGWRQEHNGYSHQGPGFVSNMLTKRPQQAAVFLPPDANSLLVVLGDCLASTDRVNVIVAGKNPAPQWLGLRAAERHCRAGTGIWDWASTPGLSEPDVVLACAGNIPTVETIAAARLLRRVAPELRVRVVNVVDLRSLAAPGRAPSALSPEAFERCFGGQTPVVFAFHGYPSAVHQLLHGRPAPNRFHVHGYLEEGTTTTPFALLAGNRMTRHDLAADALRRSGGHDAVAADLLGDRGRLVAVADATGRDADEITGWVWS